MSISGGLIMERGAFWPIYPDADVPTAQISINAPKSVGRSTRRGIEALRFTCFPRILEGLVGKMLFR